MSRIQLILAAVLLGGGCEADLTPTPLAPRDLDLDRDGLLHSEEMDLGTDPANADTDGDGWTDGEEVDGNTDPLLKRRHPYEGGWPIADCHADIEGEGGEVGDIVENFRLMDQHGETVRLHDFCDRTILLVACAFW